MKRVVCKSGRALEINSAYADERLASKSSSAHIVEVWYA